MKENLSRLMDSAIEGNERSRLFDAMADDPELRRTWQRYHLIGAALKNELGRSVDPALPDRIAESVRKEPPLGRPGRLAILPGRSFARQVGSLALAASVAALAIFTLAPHAQRGGSAGQSLASAGNSAVHVTRSGTTRWETLPPEMENTLNAYLVEHGEFSASPGLNGLTSYARFVSYDAGQ
jgi:sigma-E factor negative regulatory protein RseA